MWFIRRKESNELEEARAEFWTKINGAINEAKICVSDSKRGTKEIQRGQ